MNDIEKTENVITTYKERSLHAALKNHFCPDESMHELKMGKYVADACDGKTIFEIQTANLGKLSKKIDFYLENTEYDLVVVHPIAKNRRIFWVDKESGEVNTASRLSSKHESLCDGISNLYYIKDYIGKSRVSFCFPIMEINETRYRDGYGKNKKIRATSVDRIAGEIYSIEYVKSVEDIRKYLNSVLPDGEFGRAELSKALKLQGLKLWSAQKLLLELEILSCHKDGNRLVFKKT